jgi:hypothetical protein
MDLILKLINQNKKLILYGLVPHCITMNSNNANAQRWMRQLLLYRYSILLEQLKSQFLLSDTQENQIRAKILSMDWIDTAYLGFPNLT